MSWDFTGGSVVKNPPGMPEKRGFHPWVGNIPWRREQLPTLVFWPKEFHGLYGARRGHRELDMTERLSLFTFTLSVSAEQLVFC